MVAAVQLDRAEVRNDDCAVVGVRLNDRRRNPAVNVEPRENPDDEFTQPARHAVEDVHEVRRGIGLRHVLAVHDLVAQVLVDGIKRRFIFSTHHGKRLRRFVCELLLDDERRRHAVSLIEILVGDEAVHLRTQRDGFDQRGDDDVEHRIGEVGALRILLLQIRIHVGQIDGFGDVGFIVAAIGIDDRRNEVHAVQVAQQHTVLAVAAAALCGFFHILFTHLFLVLTKIASRPL